MAKASGSPTRSATRADEVAAEQLTSMTGELSDEWTYMESRQVDLAHPEAVGGLSAEQAYSVRQWCHFLAGTTASVISDTKSTRWPSHVDAAVRAFRAAMTKDRQAAEACERSTTSAELADAVRRFVDPQPTLTALYQQLTGAP